MPGSAFFDTTILVYIFKQGDRRSATAERLLAAGGVLSVQVLNEFANVAHRKLAMTWKEIEEALEGIRNLCSPPAALTMNTHAAALKIATRYGFHIYDSLIVASALETRCAILYSEELQHGQKIESLTIQNPFLSS
jgi:predicted nucleic acid-binding protein